MDIHKLLNSTATLLSIIGIIMGGLIWLATLNASVSTLNSKISDLKDETNQLKRDIAEIKNKSDPRAVECAKLAADAADLMKSSDRVNQAMNDLGCREIGSSR